MNVGFVPGLVDGSEEIIRLSSKNGVESPYKSSSAASEA
jgi:hypothetical protein